jgi:hypothetical protein
MEGKGGLSSRHCRYQLQRRAWRSAPSSASSHIEVVSDVPDHLRVECCVGRIPRKRARRLAALRRA